MLAVGRPAVPMNTSRPLTIKFTSNWLFTNERPSHRLWLLMLTDVEAMTVSSVPVPPAPYISSQRLASQPRSMLLGQLRE